MKIKVLALALGAIVGSACLPVPNGPIGITPPPLKPCKPTKKKQCPVVMIDPCLLMSEAEVEVILGRGVAAGQSGEVRDLDGVIYEGLNGGFDGPWSGRGCQWRPDDQPVEGQQDSFNGPSQLVVIGERTGGRAWFLANDMFALSATLPGDVDIPGLGVRARLQCAEVVEVGVEGSPCKRPSLATVQLKSGMFTVFGRFFIGDSYTTAQANAALIDAARLVASRLEPS
jgi:hypothetical protein